MDVVDGSPVLDARVKVEDAVDMVEVEPEVTLLDRGSEVIPVLSCLRLTALAILDCSPAVSTPVMRLALDVDIELSVIPWVELSVGFTKPSSTGQKVQVEREASQ